LIVKLEASQKQHKRRQWMKTEICIEIQESQWLIPYPYLTVNDFIHWLTPLRAVSHWRECSQRILAASDMYLCNHCVFTLTRTRVLAATASTRGESDLLAQNNKMNKSRLFIQNGYRVLTYFADYQHFGRHYVTRYVAGTSLIKKIMKNNSQKEKLVSEVKKNLNTDMSAF